MSKKHLFIISWNEENIIDHTINHYKEYVDKITLYDNNSTDKTISKAISVYPDIEVITFDTANRFNDGKHTEIRNNCWKKEVWNNPDDWAIIIDADEWLLFYKKDEKKTILDDEAFLNKYHSIYAKGIQAVSTRVMYNYPLLQQVKFIPDNQFGKVAAFRPFFFKETNFTNGGHGFYPHFSDEAFEFFSDDKLSKFRVSTDEVKLLHLKYINKKYLYKRHKEYANRLSRYNYAHKCGMEYLMGKEYIDEKYEEFSKHEPLPSYSKLEYKFQG
jgi:hypothetical protein